MKPHAHLRTLSAVAGGCAVVAIGLAGLSAGSKPDLESVGAPATVRQTVDEVTTTSTAPSFRPAVTATVPPPPTD